MLSIILIILAVIWATGFFLVSFNSIVDYLDSPTTIPIDMRLILFVSVFWFLFLPFRFIVSKLP